MSILVAVTETAEGRAALAAAGEEASLLGKELVVLNVGLRRLPPQLLPAGVELTVVERAGHHIDPAEVVLDYLEDNHDITRLVIGVKRRTPVGKAVFGSISQRLLLDCSVPVLAVKTPPS